MIVTNNRKKCSVTYSEVPLFFSLVDYRNNYFTSDDPNKIIEFYNGFENREQLIWWMKERPKGVANIHEVEGDKDIIVVIPTADFNGKYAKECRENIFKGLHIIFVESGEIPDPYFNGAHNVNIGIKKAMEYNPKWVVVSNDDMNQEESSEKLLIELRRIDQYKILAVFPKKSKYHARIIGIGEPRLAFYIYKRIFRPFVGTSILKHYKKFSIKLLSFPQKSVYSTFFTTNILVKEIGDFVILSSEFIKGNQNSIYDEIFINNDEDIDLALRIQQLGKSKEINYSIGEKIGGSLGNSTSRELRGLAGACYLNFKLEFFNYNETIQNS
jgi:hypothetical protein